MTIEQPEKFHFRKSAQLTEAEKKDHSTMAGKPNNRA